MKIKDVPTHDSYLVVILDEYSFAHARGDEWPRTIAFKKGCALALLDRGSYLFGRRPGTIFNEWGKWSRCVINQTKYFYNDVSFDENLEIEIIRKGAGLDDSEKDYKEKWRYRESVLSTLNDDIAKANESLLKSDQPGS